jgi:WD40 repeat protein
MRLNNLPSPHPQCKPAAFVRLAVSLTIRIIDLDTGKRSVKFSENHTSNISHIAFSLDGAYLVSACAGGRSVNVFRCTKDRESLVRTLTLVQPPTYLAVQSDERFDSTMLTLAACSDRGLTVLRFSLEEDDSSVDLESYQGATLAAGFPERSAGTQLHLASGSQASPKVEVLTYSSETGKLLEHLGLPSGGGVNATLLPERKEEVSKELLFCLTAMEGFFPVEPKRHLPAVSAHSWVTSTMS